MSLSFKVIEEILFLKSFIEEIMFLKSYILCCCEYVIFHPINKFKSAQVCTWYCIFFFFWLCHLELEVWGCHILLWGRFCSTIYLFLMFILFLWSHEFELVQAKEKLDVTIQTPLSVPMFCCIMMDKQFLFRPIKVKCIMTHNLDFWLISISVLIEYEKNPNLSLSFHV